jgi:hypothetical protein
VVAGLLLYRARQRGQQVTEPRPATPEEIMRLVSLPAQTLALGLVGALLSWAGNAPAALPIAFLIESGFGGLLWLMRYRFVAEARRTKKTVVYRPSQGE